jgi:Zn-dependent membrane protease YugP
LPAAELRTAGQVDGDEDDAVGHVLRAAARTYIAGFAASLLTLRDDVFRVGGVRRRRI